MKLSKKAKQGFEDCIADVTVQVGRGMHPDRALQLWGITSTEDVFTLFTYMRMTKREYLIHKWCEVSEKYA